MSTLSPEAVTLRVFLQAETYQNAPNRPTHGYKGPLRVSYGRGRTNVGDDYLATVEQYDRTRPVVDDANTMVDDLNCHEVCSSTVPYVSILTNIRPTSSGPSGSITRLDDGRMSHTTICIGRSRIRQTCAFLSAALSRGSSSSMYTYARVRSLRFMNSSLYISGMAAQLAWNTSRISDLTRLRRAYSPRERIDWW